MENFFKIEKVIGDKVSAKCQLCTNKVIQGSLKSTGNFMAHIKAVHPASVKKVESKRQEKKAACSIKAGTKGKNAGGADMTRFLQGKKRVTQEEVTNAVADYIIGKMAPLNTVEDPDFRNMIRRISAGNSEVTDCPGRVSIRKCLRERFAIMEGALNKEKLNLSKYVCTTADIWSSMNKSYLGMTVHLINAETLTRESFALACRRFLFSHTYDKIAEAIFEIHQEYRIPHKVTHTVTDGASNFGKAFREYLRDITESSTDSDSEEEGSLVGDSRCDVDVVEVGDVLEDELERDEDSEVQLPPQLRCSAHKLNLIATADVAKITDSTFKRVSAGAFGRAFTLWTRLSRSTAAADRCKILCGVIFEMPNKTRWNSTNRATKKMLKYKEKLGEICDALKLDKLKATDITFLEEYVTVTEPLAAALDLLQGENDCFLGMLIPTLLALKTRLALLSDLKFCEPLRHQILVKTDERFDFLHDLRPEVSQSARSYALATLSHPTYKYALTNSDEFEALRPVFLAECDTLYREEKKQQEESGEPTLPVPLNDFFSVLKATLPRTVVTATESNKAYLEGLQYLGDEETTMSVLSKYPTIKKMFLKYNTAMPSSAPVERLFSKGGLLLTPRRNGLLDTTFEMLLLLKANYKLVT